jgi:zinc protease
MLRHFSAALLLSTALISAPVTAKSSKPAPVSELVKQVDIPFEKFELDNGLTVIVHEDRKAPIVAVSIWYDVGSKHEPKGKTGYAHLFEHIMFNGSENASGDYFEYLKKIGATDLNGTTWFDRTNYFQTVPTSALESALFLESDRMGHLLNAIDQKKLDNQIGVVSNEKRQGDNEPYGLVEYTQIEALVPPTHPYGHSTIGSLEDLKAASLNDMKQWFTDHYGPNNAVLVLAGDINAAGAKPLVQKWFGDIKRGKDVKPVTEPIPALSAPKKIVMKDKVPTTRIYRNWVVSGRYDDDYTALEVGASVLGGLSSSRLDNILVRGEQSAVSVSSYILPFVGGSFFNVEADVKPGVDADIVAKRLDEILADYLANGPTADEVQRVAASSIGGQIRGLEQVGGFGGKAVALAEGELYTGDAGRFKKQMAQLADMTPAAVKTAMNKWLSRPVVEIRVVPGEREAYQEVESGKLGARTGALSSPAFYSLPESSGDTALTKPQGNILAFDGDRSKFPGAGSSPDLDFPTVEQAVLDNGIKLFFAKRSAVPAVRVAVSFDAGYAADPADKRGLASLAGGLMDEGTKTRNSTQLAEQQERLGAAVFVNSSLDRTTVGAQALSANLGATLDLLADIIKNPAFDAKEIERLRVQQLTRIKSENNQPQGIAFRNLPPLIYGAGHPYGGPLTGSGSEASVSKLTRDDIVNFHTGYIHPQKAEIFVVGDSNLKTIKKELNKRFGKWKGNGAAAPQKAFTTTLPEQKKRIVLIDRPNSPQSLIVAGHVLDAKGTDNLLTLNAANEVLGGDFLSRINMDLRETKGWSYGSSSFIFGAKENRPFMVFAPVQTNQTGPSMEAILGHMSNFNGPNGVTAEELDRTVKGNTLELPGNFEQSSSVLSQMQADRLAERSFDYAETLKAKYEALTPEAMNAEMRKMVSADKLTWLVVGDAAKVKPQLEKLGLPIEMPTEAATATDKGAN